MNNIVVPQLQHKTLLVMSPKPYFFSSPYASTFPNILVMNSNSISKSLPKYCVVNDDPPGIHLSQLGINVGGRLPNLIEDLSLESEGDIDDLSWCFNRN